MSLLTFKRLITSMLSFWLNRFAPLFLSLRICLALLQNKSIYMHFTSICNICQALSGIYLNSSLYTLLQFECITSSEIRYVAKKVLCISQRFSSRSAAMLDRYERSTGQKLCSTIVYARTSREHEAFCSCSVVCFDETEAPARCSRLRQ